MKKLNGEAGKPKTMGMENIWILQLIDDPHIASDLNYSADYLMARASGKGLCVVCKGSKFLCGKARCPLMVRLTSYLKLMPLIKGTDVEGASPPSVFVGRIGYPYVYAGPLVPPIHEDTSLFDLPELWFGKTIDEIVGFRSMLVRGKHRVHVKDFEKAGKIMEMTRELALSTGPVDVELDLKNKPRRSLILDDEVQPFGPSALIRDVSVGTSRWDHQIQKAYDDTDLKAAEAVISLYERGA